MRICFSDSVDAFSASSKLISGISSQYGSRPNTPYRNMFFQAVLMLSRHHESSSPVFRTSMGADRTPPIGICLSGSFDAFTASLKLISGTSNQYGVDPGVKGTETLRIASPGHGFKKAWSLEMLMGCLWGHGGSKIQRKLTK